jgi:N-acetylmuramoyl-L-alanine amidase
MCLALNVYYEANTESELGQLAVAHVTMNRALHNKQNVCKVVYASKQFSWTAKETITIPSKEDLKAARKIAASVVSGHTKDPTNGATYFHHIRAHPKWKNLKRTVQIGNHVFYKK